MVGVEMKVIVFKVKQAENIKKCVLEQLEYSSVTQTKVKTEGKKS